MTDAQDRPGPAAVRCLAAGGYRVSATARWKLAPGFFARGCSAHGVVPDTRDGLDAHVDGLEQFVAEHKPAVLLPGTDETLYVVSSRRALFEPIVAMGLPPEPVVQRALSKECLGQAAAAAGIPTPESRVCVSFDEALSAARELGFPCLVKGADVLAERDGKLVRHPTRLVADEDQLQQAHDQIGRCIVQRRIDGTMLCFAGVATERGLLGSMLVRYKRTWPPVAGMASFSETIPIPRPLLDRVGALVEGIGWRGIFQLQLVESADGILWPIDFNPRLFGSIGLARPAGVPLCSLWSSWLLNEDPAPVTATPGVAYRWEDGDLRNIVWRTRRGDYRGAAAALVPKRGTAHPYFELRDPLPFLAHCYELGSVRLRRAQREPSR